MLSSAVATGRPKSAFAIERDNERTAVNAHGAFGSSARRNPIR
jgi:hypothetical protein